MFFYSLGLSNRTKSIFVQKEILSDRHGSTDRQEQCLNSGSITLTLQQMNSNDEALAFVDQHYPDENGLVIKILDVRTGLWLTVGTSSTIKNDFEIILRAGGVKTKRGLNFSIDSLTFYLL